MSCVLSCREGVRRCREGGGKLGQASGLACSLVLLDLLLDRRHLERHAHLVEGQPAFVRKAEILGLRALEGPQHEVVRVGLRSRDAPLLVQQGQVRRVAEPENTQARRGPLGTNARRRDAGARGRAGQGTCAPRPS